MTGYERREPVARDRDGRAWPIGTADEVDWITNGTRIDRTIASGIPPVFAAYATVVLPDPEDGLDPPEREIEWAEYFAQWQVAAPRRHGLALVDVLREHSAGERWWLGYLHTGASDIVFPDAPMVSVYHSR